MKVLSSLRELGGKALNFFFPKRCLGCGKEGDFICPVCFNEFVPLAPPFCLRCGKSLRRAQGKLEPDGKTCPNCADWTPAIDGIRSVFRFQGVAREAVHGLKYNHIRALAPYMAELMASYLKESPLPGEVLVAVPLHTGRLRERGYNQSYLLAKELSVHTGLELSNCLLRNRNTPSQTKTVNVGERHKNVSGAFSCNGDTKGRRVILIDDVVTSGATLDECAKMLKEAGAESVWGFTFAREI